MTPLDQVNTHLWSKLGQNPGQTPYGIEHSPERFAAFFKIHLNTPKSPNIKVVQFFRGTQICFWAALQIWNGKWRKTRSTVDFNFHRRHEKPGLCSTFLLKPLRKV
jgi:hypothetical protein